MLIELFEEQTRGPPENITLLRLAERFMGDVRASQKESGVALVGRVGSKRQYSSALEISDHSSLVRTIKEIFGISSEMDMLLIRFEHMCARRGFHIKNDLRPAIVRLLAIELCANALALKEHPRRLIGFTVLQGAFGHALVTDNEFEKFIDSPGLFREAAHRHPADPKGFLLHFKATLAKLEHSDEFSHLPDRVRRQAVLRYADPEHFLRSVTITASHP